MSMIMDFGLKNKQKCGIYVQNIQELIQTRNVGTDILYL